MSRPARRDLEVAHRREDILIAASRAFARLGFEGATLRDIAREAGYTVATLYAYFQSKQEIREALFARIRTELDRAFKAPDPPVDSFAQKLQVLLRRLGEFLEGWHEAVVFLNESECGPRLASRGVEHPFLTHLTGWIRRSASPKDIGRRDPQEAARVLHGIMHGAFAGWLHEGGRRGTAKQQALVLDVFLHGVGKRR